MSDQERPLSRRERRAQEQREAHRLDDTAPLEPGLDTEGLPLFGPDGRPLSRRERRRLERLNHPVETWTAEEEMIATGQIPAMTPERIAEQERLAREKAEAVQRDARTASAEIAHVNETEDDESEFHPAGEWTDSEEAQPASDEPVAPRRESLIPESSAPEAAVADEAPEAEAVDVVDGDAVPEDVSVEGPAADSEDVEPLRPAPSPQTPLGMPPGMSPEMFAMLFPPGSAQRRLIEEQATAASPASAPDVESETLEHDEVPDTQDDAAPHETVASPEMPESYEQLETHEAQQVSAPQESPEPWGYEPTEPERPVDMWAQAASQSHQEPASEPMSELQQGEPSFEQILHADESAPEDAPATGAVPAFVPVSAASTDHDGYSSAHAAYASTGHADQGAPSPWDSHPLMTAEVPQVTGELDLDLDDESLEAEPLPRPDLSGVHTSTNPAPADVEPVPTGNFSVEPREKPQLHPAGGAHHFGWAQLAVIGAVAFVLGVIVWNVLKGS